MRSLCKFSAFGIIIGLLCYGLVFCKTKINQLQSQADDLTEKFALAQQQFETVRLQTEFLCEVSEGMALQNSEFCEFQTFDFNNVPPGECVLCSKNYIERRAVVTHYGINASKDAKTPLLRITEVPMDFLKAWKFQESKKAPFDE